MKLPSKCPICNDVITGIDLNNNVQCIWVDKGGYDMIDNIPIGRSGEYEPHYIPGRREVNYLPCRCPG